MKPLMTSLLFIAECDTKVQFYDPNVETAIRIAIEKYNGAILKSDLEGLRQLRACSKKITNLNGVEHCTNLQGLALYGNQIIDISPLSNMTKLWRLELHANQISDASPLGKMTILKELRLTGNQISDISPLSNMTNLHISFNEGRDMNLVC